MYSNILSHILDELCVMLRFQYAVHIVIQLNVLE